SLTDWHHLYEQQWREGCGCDRACHRRFPDSIAFEAHLDALELDHYCQSHVNHQHLLLMGAMNALLRNPGGVERKRSMPHHRHGRGLSSLISERSKKQPQESTSRTNSRTFFRFRGQEVC